jgi:hypothetical protein
MHCLLVPLTDMRSSFKREEKMLAERVNKTVACNTIQDIKSINNEVQNSLKGCTAV